MEVTTRIMKIEFIKGRERNLSANQIKIDKLKYELYIVLCTMAKDKKPITFKEYFGYEVIFRYSLN